MGTLIYTTNGADLRTRTALALGRAEKVDVLDAEVRVPGMRDRPLERRTQYAEMEAKPRRREFPRAAVAMVATPPTAS